MLIVVNIHQSEICSVKENPTILMEYEWLVHVINKIHVRFEVHSGHSLATHCLYINDVHLMLFLRALILYLILLVIYGAIIKKKTKIYIVLISVVQNLSNPLSNYTELDRCTKISKIRIQDFIREILIQTPR